MTIATIDSPIGLTESRWLVEQAHAPRLRTLREFAEAEIVIPDGPYAGRRFRIHRQPYTGLLFDALDSGQWTRVACVGPTQSGKTLSAYVIPVLYHLFEIGETVICGLPDQNMADDKWRQDLSPVLARTRYDDLRPSGGAGSRGGAITNAIQFKNGATLKWMTGGGRDAKRAHFTARVVAVTEADKLDEAGAASREGDKISQMEARSDAFGGRARTYLECTASIKVGRIWREYQTGTASRIACPCPHCGEYVTPEREHLVAWKDAENIVAAKRAAHWACPSCGAAISDDERRAMNETAILLHRGQNVKRGRVVGDAPETDTLGFRWSAFNNLFWSASDIAAREWKAARDPNEENAMKVMRQFCWALPYEPPRIDLTALDVDTLCRRQIDLARGHVPSGTECVTVGVDLGKYQIHWAAAAWSANASPHVFDYGVADVASHDLGVERALLQTLRGLRDIFEVGWPDAQGERDERHVPAVVFLDAGWMGTEVVYPFVREAPEGYQAAKGLGQSQTGRTYTAPKTTGNVVVLIGENYHAVNLASEGILLFEVDADAWKSWLHARAATPLGEPGALSVFTAKPADHLMFARHLTSERQITEFRAGVGDVVRWENPTRRANHYLDASYLACAAAHWADIRLIPETAEPEPESDPPKRRPLTTPDGRPFLVTER